MKGNGRKAEASALRPTLLKRLKKEEKQSGEELFITGMVFSLSMILLSASVWAICTQKHLEGTWNIKGVHQEIGPDGTIANGKNLDNCLSDKKSKVIGEQLFISSGCDIEGTLETSEGTFSIERGGIAGDELVLDRAEN